MIVFDTSALVRFLTNDDPKKALEVKKILDSNNKISIPDVVFPEIEYVLLSGMYEVSRKKLTKTFRFLVSRKQTQISDVVQKAVELYADSKLDMADCIVAASALDEELYSFDEKLQKLHKKYNCLP